MSKRETERLIESFELSIKFMRTEIQRLKKTLVSKIVSKGKDFDANYRLLKIGLTSSRKPNKQCDKIPVNLNWEQLGRAGEIAYQNYLHEILDLNHCQIKWLNQGVESRKPYDFEVTICGEVFYIDVKTTRGNQGVAFYLSEAEIKFAKTVKNNYFVARLSQFDEYKRYKADSFNVKMIDLPKALDLLNGFKKDPNYQKR